MELLKACPLCRSAKISCYCEGNRFFRCAECGHYFDNPRPSLREISDHYGQEEKYDDWLKHLPERERMWKRRIRMLLKHRRSGTLLDIGAGIGQFLSLARNHFDVEGTELSSTAIRLARERYGISLHSGSLESIPTTKTYDMITLFHVLEHVQHPGETLERIRSLLNPDGLVFIAVPNDVESVLTRRNRLMRELGFSKYQSLGNLGIPRLSLEMSEIHLSHFTVSSLTRAFGDAGLHVREVNLDPYFAVSGWGRSVRRILRFWRYRWWQILTGKNWYETIWMVGVAK